MPRETSVIATIASICSPYSSSFDERDFTGVVKDCTAKGLPELAFLVVRHMLDSSVLRNGLVPPIDNPPREVCVFLSKTLADYPDIVNKLVSLGFREPEVGTEVVLTSGGDEESRVEKKAFETIIVLVFRGRITGNPYVYVLSYESGHYTLYTLPPDLSQEIAKLCSGDEH